jgi:hypothetical protein
MPMFSKKQLVLISFTLAILFHFIFYFNLYGPSLGVLDGEVIYLFPFASSVLMLFVYFGTYWRVSLRGTNITIVFDILLAWILISLVRSLLQCHNFGDIRELLLSNYLGLSLFPVLFFISGIKPGYFSAMNKILSIYILIAAFVSMIFVNYFEFQLFLLLPIFYLIITIPLRTPAGKIMVILITVSIIIVSFTNRAGLMRILISFSILGAYYIMKIVRINKKLLYTLVFLVLMIPVVSLYLGMKGQSVFQIVLGEEHDNYSQLNPYADTRTFLYYEVFQDLRLNKAFLFGKGMNAGYASESFGMFNRQIVEVGFLQMLLKTGIIGCLLYFWIILSAVFKALGKSKSLFMKALGLLIASYLLLFFIENIIAYNLLNIVIWFSIGVCHSQELRELNDQGIGNLFKGVFNPTPKLEKIPRLVS